MKLEIKDQNNFMYSVIRYGKYNGAKELAWKIRKLIFLSIGKFTDIATVIVVS
ncbi:hypothetical protein [Gracilibacillus sp. JCM 18860]|uniref:hypothetical protein n=1 Tax=Gracilibacillus sp. JCM 18860 TaxID=1306159 RepID=UPI000B2189B7